MVKTEFKEIEVDDLGGLKEILERESKDGWSYLTHRDAEYLCRKNAAVVILSKTIGDEYEEDVPRFDPITGHYIWE